MNNNKYTSQQIADAFDMFRKLIEIYLLRKSYHCTLNDTDKEIHQISRMDGSFKKLIDQLNIKKILESDELEKLLKFFQDNQLQKIPGAMTVVNDLIKSCPGKIEIILW